MCDTGVNEVDLMFGGPQVPDMPTLPQSPVPQDLSSMYQTQSENQQAQNTIASGQLGLAERQQAIAEDRYNTWQTGFKPLEISAIEDARRGRNTNKAGAMARNSVMQQATPAITGQFKGTSRQGVSPDSPAAVAKARGLQVSLAAEAGSQQTAGREAEEARNRSRKAQAVQLGANVPGEVVAGYGTAAGVMGDAGNRMNAAAGAVSGMQQQIAGLNTSMANNRFQNQQNIAMQQYQIQNAQNQAEYQNLMGAVNSLSSTASTALFAKVMMACIPEGTMINVSDRMDVAIEDISAGDIVFGSDGKPCAVMQKHEYAEVGTRADRWVTITFDDGKVVRCCDTHVVGKQAARHYRVGDKIDGKTIKSIDVAIKGVRKSYDLLTTCSETGGYMIGGVGVRSMIPALIQFAKDIQKEG